MADDELTDIGDVLSVPVKDRLDEDDLDPNEVNEDEGRIDFSDVPDGEVVVLSSAPGPEED